MEVAGQWRREWAGSAEYGKVTEGGVTRRVARAMEVLHASAPGARVRVMRAAYHSSAGPGAPAASYLMHSSRQILSSGFNFLEPSPVPSTPLEISSTPLESSPDSEVEKETYKVTEPDDYDISEPSKWRASSGKNSFRMPSEESSSADNASIIDLDSRTSNMNTNKRTLQSKNNYVKSKNHITNNRVSPLLDAPAALSTLKYTSILNSTDEWNNRRKSYSFEDTSPILNQNDSFTTFMDSSTDSGICKSTEIVNDPLISSSINMKHDIDNEKIDKDETFKDWLSRNRFNSYRENSMTPPRSYRTIESQQNEGKITLQSSGKVSITLPVETQKTVRSERSFITDDTERRTKRVEFCKTELHFAAETGTVNIIATDEKPPPSNDFRRRRSAFVPLNNKVDRSITLFGEKTEFSEVKADHVIPNNEVEGSEENTAATKSILKNKIPKPKPYLLGENMVFGISGNDPNSLNLNGNVKTTNAVSLINSQLQSERRHTNENISSSLIDIEAASVNNNTNRTGSKGPHQSHSLHRKTPDKDTIEILDTKSVIKNTRNLPMSKEESKPKIRELKGSELAYFGIERNERNESFKFNQCQNNLQEEIFHSVKLVQQVSNSVCNSEAESDDGPEYQNIPTTFNIPTPSPRSKYEKEVRKISEQTILKPICEIDSEQIALSDLQNNSLKRHKEPLKPLHPSAIESRKTFKDKQSRQKQTRKDIESPPVSPGKAGNNLLKRLKNNKENETSNFTRNSTTRDKTKSEMPLYVNINIKERQEKFTPNLEITNLKATDLRKSLSKDPKSTKEAKSSANTSNRKSVSPIKKDNSLGKPKENLRYEDKDKKYDIKRESYSQKRTPKRTEKLATPEIVHESTVEQSSLDIKKDSRNGHSTHIIQRTSSLKKSKRPNLTNCILEDENVRYNNKYDDMKNKEKGIIRITKVLNKNSIPSATPEENKFSSKSSRNTITSQNSMVHSNKAEKIPNIKLDKSTKPKRSKYVINYDDKNGTVSSICKIKKGPGTYTRKIIPIENKNTQDSSITKDKSLNKIALRK